MLIKISISGQPKNADLSQFVGNSKNQMDDHQFVVNADVEKADAWFIVEDIEDWDTKCVVPSRQIHFLTAETSYGLDHYLLASKRSFLSQFSQIHTCHATDLPNTSYASPFLPWMVNSNHGSIFERHWRDINFLNQFEGETKDRPLSIFCSQQNLTPHHRLRLSFAQHLKKHFGDDIDWYGNGINTVREKWDGLARYERTIVLENRADSDVYSEKILDPFLSLTQAIYAGAPNIKKFLPVAPSHQINLRDFSGSVKQIERILRKPVGAREQGFLVDGRNQVLGELHFLRRIARIAEKNIESPINSPRARVELRPRRTYTHPQSQAKTPMSFEDKIYSTARRVFKKK